MPTDSSKDERHIHLVVAGIYMMVGLALLSMAFNLMIGEMKIKIDWFSKKMGLNDIDEAVNKT